MFSESDESTYTVHEVPSGEQPAVQEAEPATQVAEEPGTTAPTGASKSPLARYYRLGTQERHIFDERTRRVRQQSAAYEAEQQFRAAHPFQPQRGGSAATATPVVQPATNSGSSSQPNAASAPARPVFDRLAAQAAQLELRRRHREEQQRRAEAAALRGAFQPHINQVDPAHAERLKHLQTVPVETRLLHYGEHVARERQRKQELKELEEAAAWQAAQVTAVGSSGRQPPDAEERRRQRAEFEARSARFLAERDQHRQAAEATAAEAFSFQPRISTTSAALDEARQRLANDVRHSELSQLLSRSVDGPALSISNQQSAANASRRSAALYALAVSRQRAGKEEDAANANGSRASITPQSGGAKSGTSATGAADTHQPVTNPTSDKWIAKSAHRSFFETDFVRRQTLYEEVKREEVALRASVLQHEEDEQKSPSQSNQSTSGAAAPTQKVNERQLTQRLYYDAQKTAEAAAQRREAALTARECPFRPQLSPGTRTVLRHMDNCRDSDVVRRLTAQPCSGPTATRRPDAGAELDLYAPVPARGLQRQGRSRVPSSARSSRPEGAVESREAALPAWQARSASRSQSASARTAPVGRVEASREPSGATDATPTALPSPQEQQQQPKRQRRPTVTRDQIEHFYQRQITALQQRQDLIQERKEGEAVQELVECTFRPRTNNSASSGESGELPTGGGAGAVASVSRVTGVTDFLERQAAARQRKVEHDEMVRSMGLPRHRRGGGGSASGSSSGFTVLSPFRLQTEKLRQRSSCSPAGGRECSGPAVFSVVGLTTAERALHDVLAESHQRHAANSQAPLCALPGYSEEDEGVVYVDDAGAHEWVDGYEDGEDGDEDDGRGRLGSTDPRQRGSALAAAHSTPGSQALSNGQLSLFSSISPNTFSGRGLRAAQVGGAGGKGSVTGLSALKGAAQRPATGQQHRGSSRSVSFAIEDGEASRATDARQGQRTRHLDADHLAFLRGRF